MSRSLVVDWAGVRSSETKRRAEEVFRDLGASLDLREGCWDEAISQQASSTVSSLIVLADLNACAAQFRRVDVHQWTHAARATNAYFVLLVRNLIDQKYASLVDDIVYASDNRAVVHSLIRSEYEALKALIRHALGATEPTSVTDVRLSEDSDSLWLEFGDGKRGILPWSSLSLDRLKPRLDPSTAMVSEDLASVQVLREDGSVFDIDSTVLRAAFDERLTRKLATDAVRATAELGKQLRATRKLHRLTQMELARKSRLDQGLISRLEHGKQRPGFSTLTKYAMGLGLTVSELLA